MNERISFRCQNCNANLSSARSGFILPCPRCKQPLQVPYSQAIAAKNVILSSPPARAHVSDPLPEPESLSSYPPELPFPSLPHSNLGIASFLIAALVVVMDVLLGLVIATNVSTSARAEASMVSGALGMVCLNCLSAPICLIGAVLGGTAIFTGTGKKNLMLAYIGTALNSLVVLVLLALYMLGAATGAKSKPSNTNYLYQQTSFREYHDE